MTLYANEISLDGHICSSQTGCQLKPELLSNFTKKMQETGNSVKLQTGSAGNFSKYVTHRRRPIIKGFKLDNYLTQRCMAFETLGFAQWFQQCVLPTIGLENKVRASKRILNCILQAAALIIMNAMISPIGQGLRAYLSTKIKMQCSKSHNCKYLKISRLSCWFFKVNW